MIDTDAQTDTQTEREAIAENKYRQGFSHTIDFGIRKRSKYTLIHGDPKPERTVCKNAPAPRRSRGSRQKTFVAGGQNMSLRGLCVAAEMDRLAREQREAKAQTKTERQLVTA